ncbi:MAG: IS91 family transposase, partial [Firmicutes bacterium HGW-Firmicutes-14]
MLEMQDVFSRFGDSYVNSHAVHYEGLKAINAISKCRTSSLGGHMDVCDSCGHSKISYNSCRNRNCPKCGNLHKEQWILDRSSELLPVGYFHTVFTVPHQLNSLFLSNQELMYSLLFKSAAETLTLLALDKKYLGAQIGVTMVLHSWGQNLSFH